MGDGKFNKFMNMYHTELIFAVYESADIRPLLIESEHKDS